MKNKNIIFQLRSRSHRLVLACIFVFTLCSTSVFGEDKENFLSDTIPLYANGKIRKSIYPQTASQHRGFYNFLWGKHYRKLYSTPITVKLGNLNSLYGGLKFERQAPLYNGLLLKNKKGQFYLLRPVDGSSAFLKSSFFNKVYTKKDFKETYLDQFISDAYTIAYPYAFIITDELAGKVGLNSFDPTIYYIPKQASTDTIADGSGIEDRLVSIYDLSAFSSENTIIKTDTLLQKMQDDKNYRVNQSEYIRERLLDMLFGDWNKSKENWRWIEKKEGDKVIYSPIMLDRNNAFAKVDGFLFKGILGMFGLGSIMNYGNKISNIKKLNAVGYPLDVALTGGSGEHDWVAEARYISAYLTNSVIDSIFRQVPHEIQGRDLDAIKTKLKARRNGLEYIARQYYKQLLKTPVVTGTNSDDRIVIDREGNKNVTVSIYDAKSNSTRFSRKYTKETNEIWLYGLGGNDRFEVLGNAEKATPIVLSGGRGNNSYQISNSGKVNIYEYPSYDLKRDTLGKAKIIRTDIDKVHQYDFEKLKYNTFDFTPWGIYDTDLGLYIGAYVTRTVYGFKRSPYSYRHRLGYNYLNGFMYQGFFPSYDEKRMLILEAFASSGTSFTNFFGYGNESNPYKNESQNYNRIYYSKYSITPSYYLKLKSGEELVAKSMLELFSVHKQENKFITKIYTGTIEDFKTKLFADISLTYDLSKQLNPFVSLFSFSATTGWKFNIGDIGRNYQYVKSNLGFNFSLTDRLVLATQLGGAALLTDKYEFYQATSTNLRGFRNNRFIGKQSFFQQTDLRVDMGRLENPFTPVNYGVFLGFDHGRVWYPQDQSKKWHRSYGGGFWLTFFKSYTGKFSYFKSDEGHRLWVALGMGF